MEPMATKAYDLSKLEVLVVEKQAPMRALLRQVLREFSITKIEDAYNPEHGFEVFNELSPDLVLVDWAPDFDGLSLVRRIRTDAASVFPQAPVIMISAYNETNYVYDALDAGMTEYLAKPISANLLYSRMAAVIESKRAFILCDDFTGPDRRRHQGSFGGEERRRTGSGHGDRAAA